MHPKANILLMKLLTLLLTPLCATLLAAPVSAQSNASTASTSSRDGEGNSSKTVTLTLPSWMPKISGTIRAKGEYQLSEKEGRFEVRNARVALDGEISKLVIYKAEIDLSDEGKIKMLDAYAGLRPIDGGLLRLGQMRVPFSIDAHRSPHAQLFANRSFIAKQVGNVRDVGFAATYTPASSGLTLEAGVFNGSGLTNQVDYWTNSLNFSAKAQWKAVKGLTLQASVQKVRPAGGSVWLYDGGFTLNVGRWTLEAEYLRKHYTSETFKDVNALDAFLYYDLPLRGTLKNLRFLARYDAMGDHSDGSLNDDGTLKLTDAARQRLTVGTTLTLAKGVDLRLNYENYFYDNSSLAKTSERDKLVAELMVHF